VSDTILVIEDEALLGQELQRHFRQAGWDVTLARDLASARRTLLDEGLDPLLVLSDMSLPDGNALDLLEELSGSSARGEWLLLTGYGTVADSVRALKLGAYDFLEKPCDLGRLDLVVASATRSARAQRRLREITENENRRYSIEAFVGRSREAAAVREMVGKLHKVPISAVVIDGETGTGKGLVARILHHCGPRAKSRLVEVNCAALPRELLESELFGHEAGAFTGARTRRRGLIQQASGGSLLLDEISEMPLDLQSKLLKVLEDRAVRPLGADSEIEVDLQVMAASNRGLAGCVKDGTFRQDLYHRLSVFSLELPPLRRRKQDLEDLVPLIVAEYGAKVGKVIRVIPDSFWERLRSYDWPGNVRELRNVLERSVLLSEGGVLSGRWLQLERSGPSSAASQAVGEEDQLRFPLDGSVSIEQMERRIVEAALERSSHNTTAAARLLGTTRQTLRYRIQKYGLKTSGE
jgi:DNA-binding NtrC family response regulator